MEPGPDNGIVLQLRLIGQMEAWTVGRRSVLPAGRKTRALLAYLALASPRNVPRARIAELLFRDRPDDQARVALRHEFRLLVDALAPAGAGRLKITRNHIVLTADRVWIDVQDIQRADVNNPAALALLDGELMEGMEGIEPAFDTWLTAEREKLRDGARGVAEALLSGQLEPERIILAARRLLLIDPTHEGAWRALVRAHTTLGDGAMAMRIFSQCRNVLARHLNVAPSRETQALVANLDISDPSPPETMDGGNRCLSAAKAQDNDGPRVGILRPRMAGPSRHGSGDVPAIATAVALALGRFKWLTVMPSAMLGNVRPEHRDDARIRRDFGVDYLLDGTVQPIDTGWRFMSRLRDLRLDGQVLWARRFEWPVAGPPSARDDIVALTAVAIDHAMLMAESTHCETAGTKNPTAYELTMQSLPLTLRMERAGFMRAGEYLEQAIAIDPNHTNAHYWHAFWNAFLVGQRWTSDPAEAVARCWRSSEKAMTLSPFRARVVALAGHVRAFTGHDLREAAALHDRALELNPYLPMAWALSAITLTYLGELDEAERRFKRYKFLSPLNALAFLFDTCGALIALLRNDYRAAADAGRMVTQTRPAFTAGYKPFLAALGHLGRKEEAAAVARRFLALEPDFTVDGFLSTYPLVSHAFRDHYETGLRRAGLP